MCLSESGERVGSLPGLRDDYNAGIMKSMCRAVGIFTRVFDVDRDPRQIFKHDFTSQASVSAGTTGGNNESFSTSESIDNRLKRLCCRKTARHILFDGRG